MSAQMPGGIAIAICHLLGGSNRRINYQLV